MDTLISFVFATTLLAISPGPDNIYVLVQSVTNGKWYGISTVGGLITGCIVHTTLVAFGVSVLIKNNESIFLGLKIVGAAYLLFLAYKVYCSPSTIKLDVGLGEKQTYRQLFTRGFFMNVLNPKVSIFFLALFPGFLFSDELSTVIQFYILGLIFMLVSFIIFTAIAVLAARISRLIREKEGIGSIFKWGQILVFIGIALYILLSEN